jgi:hypothetical protein
MRWSAAPIEGCAMKRRHVLSLVGAAASAPAARVALSQGRGVSRAAVVIGVDKAGWLPPLSAAASGAREVADWLQAEGMTVKRLIDNGREVRASEVFDAIAELVSLGTLEQLTLPGQYSIWWRLKSASAMRAADWCETLSEQSHHDDAPHGWQARRWWRARNAARHFSPTSPGAAQQGDGAAGMRKPCRSSARAGAGRSRTAPRSGRDRVPA